MTTKDAGSPMDQQKLDALRALGVDPDPLIAKARANEARALLDGVDFKSVQLKDAPAWPEGVLFGDLTIDEASAWWAASITGPLLEQINALAAGAPMPTTKAFGPKTSPADPLDADLERVRQSVVEASQRLGDSQIGKELQAFAQRLQQLAGIQAPTAAGTLQDDQAPLPTTKAADAPHLFDPVPAQKGGGLGDIFAGAFGHRNGRN